MKRSNTSCCFNRTIFFLFLIALCCCSGKGKKQHDADAQDDVTLEWDADGRDGITEEAEIDGAADPAEDPAADPSTDWTDPPTTTMTLNATDEIFLNPERGFYRSINLLSEGGYGWVRDEGITLAHTYVRLDDYRDRDLDAEILDAVAAGMDRVREAGIKIILRCSYNFGIGEPDASKDWILRHIEQLEPVLRDNADIIALMQAGFIGAWGEWHSSTNGLMDNHQDKYDILEAVLAALPEERMVQVRTPMYKSDEYGEPLAPAEAYSGSSAARIGHHNDCFLASDTDWGTYPSGEIEFWKDYLEQDTRYVVMGGETCNLNPPRSDCPTAMDEMQRFHYSYINMGYHPDVVAGWESQGCMGDMQRSLGYRFVVSEVTFPPAAPPGGVLPLLVRLSNEGWSAVYNPRPVWVVLDGPSPQGVVLEGVDPRWWMAGQEVEITVRLQLPANLEAGSYTLGLWLPDAAESLASDSRYAIRFANESTWVEESGLNVIATMEIDPEAPGSVDPDADRFFVID